MLTILPKTFSAGDYKAALRDVIIDGISDGTVVAVSARSN
jgi:hypothetical protein